MTVVLIDARRVVRWDEGDGDCREVSRPVGGGLGEAVRAVVGPGSRVGRVWVLSADVFTQRLALSPAQVAGLDEAQLMRALSFEAEPFSGLSVGESATGFRAEGGGAFSVAQVAAADRAAVVEAVRACGGTLAGIAPAGAPPDDGVPLAGWMAGELAALESGSAVVIRAPAAPKSQRRFLIAAVALEAAVLLAVVGAVAWNGLRRAVLERALGEVAEATRQVDAVTLQLAAARNDERELREQAARREMLAGRRGSLAAVLRQCAASVSGDMVVRGIEPDGVSRLKVSGIALEAGAVDELGMVLSRLLKPHGWSAQPSLKRGRKTQPGGGPWEFVLELTHRDAALRPSAITPGREAE